MCCLIDLTGKKFGMLTVIEKSKKNNRTAWKCLCDCGNIVIRRSDTLNSKSKCKTCQYKEVGKNAKIHNLKPHRYKIGEIVNGIQILETIRQPYKKYKYVCTKCGDIGYITESHLLRGSGCGVCSKHSTKIKIGVNDIPTTNPKIVKFFSGGYEEAKHYSKCSTKLIDFQCPECGRIIRKRICDVSRHNSIGCKCNENKSYPERYVYCALQQLNVAFETEKQFDWSGRLRYDFFVVNNNKTIIIEVHGNQHYSNSRFNNIRTLSEEQKNDAIKKQLARENGIDHYIIIDARKSDSGYIYESIKRSEFIDIFNINIVDFSYCDNFATKNRIKDLCGKYPSLSVKELSDQYHISTVTVNHYLKKGQKQGWCVYNVNHHLKPIICKTTNKTYNSIAEASRELGISSSSIICCLKGRTKTAGRHPETGERLIWEYINNTK